MVLTSSNEKNTRSTPGPWRVEDVGIPGTLAIMTGSTTEYRWIATVTEDMGSGVDWAQTQANARVIAAVPRMLYALQIAALHLSISDDTCADTGRDGNRCLECLGCSVDMARSEVRKALAEAGSGPL